MPVCTLVPTTVEAETRISMMTEELRSSLKKVICNSSGFPEYDVLIHFARCPYLDADPLAVDIVLYADTCPHEELEVKANSLRDLLAQVLINMGFTVGTGAEVWFRFLPGAWAFAKGGKILDIVDHPRK